MQRKYDFVDMHNSIDSSFILFPDCSRFLVGLQQQEYHLKIQLYMSMSTNPQVHIQAYFTRTTRMSTDSPKSLEVEILTGIVETFGNPVCH